MNWWSTYSTDSNIRLSYYKEGRPKDYSGPWSIEASMMDRRKMIWEHVTVPKWKLVLGIKVIIITLLGLSVMWGKKTSAASMQKPLEALLPQNCHFLYHL